jgi:type I site-specific restriction endonuclease
MEADTGHPGQERLHGVEEGVDAGGRRDVRRAAHRQQGIDDGFLAPYRVIRIDIDKDLTGWRPERDKRDKYGTLIEDRIYNQKDFDRILVLEQRTALVARKVSDFLKKHRPGYS